MVYMKQYDTNDIEDSELVIETFKFNICIENVCKTDWFYKCLIFYFEFYRKFNLSEVGS